MRFQKVQGPGFFANCYVFTKAVKCRGYSKNTDYMPQVSHISLTSLIVDDEKEVIALSIRCGNLLQTPFITELLKPLELKSWQYHLAEINIHFDLELYSITEINNLITRIFSLLRTVNLSAADEAYFLNGKDQCLNDLKQGTISANKQLAAANDVEPSSADQIELLELIRTITTNVKKIWQMLQSGYSVNHRLYGMPVLSFAIDFTFLDRIGTIELYNFIMLFLRYGANPHQKGLDGHAPVDIVIDRLFDEKYSPVASNMIKLLSAAKNARFFTTPHSSDRSYPAKLIREANLIIEQRNSKLPPLYILDKESPHQQVIQVTDGTKIEVQTENVQNLTERRRTEIFNFFKEHYPWKKCGIAIQDLPAYFNNTFINTGKKTEIDLLVIQEKLVGFNIAEINEKNINGQNIIFLRVALACATKDFTIKYKRLMSLISSQRGFILQKQKPESRVITGFEAASEYSYMQVRDLDCFPLLLRDFASLILELYPNQKFKEGNIPMHIPDQAAFQEPRKEPSEWIKPEELALKFYDDFLFLPGHCLIIAYDNDPINLAKISESINPLLVGGMTFSNIIDIEANRNTIKPIAKSDLTPKSKL